MLPGQHPTSPAGVHRVCPQGTLHLSSWGTQGMPPGYTPPLQLGYRGYAPGVHPASLAGAYRVYPTSLAGVHRVCSQGTPSLSSRAQGVCPRVHPTSPAGAQNRQVVATWHAEHTQGPRGGTNTPNRPSPLQNERLNFSRCCLIPCLPSREKRTDLSCEYSAH